MRKTGSFKDNLGVPRRSGPVVRAKGTAMSRQRCLCPRTGHPPECVCGSTQRADVQAVTGTAGEEVSRTVQGDRGGLPWTEWGGGRLPVEVTLELRVALAAECRGLGSREPLRVVGLWLISGEFNPGLPARPRAHCHTSVLLWGCPRSPALSPDAHCGAP